MKMNALDLVSLRRAVGFACVATLLTSFGPLTNTAEASWTGHIPTAHTTFLYGVPGGTYTGRIDYQVGGLATLTLNSGRGRVWSWRTGWGRARAVKILTTLRVNRGPGRPVLAITKSCVANSSELAAWNSGMPFACAHNYIPHWGNPAHAYYTEGMRVGAQFCFKATDQDDNDWNCWRDYKWSPWLREAP